MISRERVKAILFPLIALAVVVCDQIAKRIALASFPDESELVEPGILAFAIHKNFGVAFNIPFRLPFVIVLTLVVLLLLAKIALRHWKSTPKISTACLLIILGALGNLLDRVFLEFTVDYLIFFGRSALNLSDIVIVLGVVMLLFASRRTHRHPPNQSALS